MQSCCGSCFGGGAGGKGKKKNKNKHGGDSDSDESTSDDDAYGFMTSSKRARGGSYEPDGTAKQNGGNSDEPAAITAAKTTSQTYQGLPSNNNKTQNSAGGGGSQKNSKKTTELDIQNELGNFGGGRNAGIGQNGSNRSKSETPEPETPISVRDRIRCFEKSDDKQGSPPGKSGSGSGVSEVVVRDSGLEAAMKPKKKKPMSKAFEDFEKTGFLIGFGPPKKKQSSEDDPQYNSEFTGFPEASTPEDAVDAVFSSPDHVIEEDGVGSIGSMEYKLPSLSKSHESDQSISLSSGSKLTEDDGFHTMESEEDDFSSAVPRQTEILKAFRRAPPPKNRQKSRRSMGKGGNKADDNRPFNGSGVKEEDETDFHEPSDTKDNLKTGPPQQIEEDYLKTDRKSIGFSDGFRLRARNSDTSKTENKRVLLGESEPMTKVSRVSPPRARPTSFNDAAAVANKTSESKASSLNHANSLRSWRENVKPVSSATTVEKKETNNSKPDSGIAWRDKSAQSSQDSPSGYDSASPGFKPGSLNTTPDTSKTVNSYAYKSRSVTSSMLFKSPDFKAPERKNDIAKSKSVDNESKFSSKSYVFPASKENFGDKRDISKDSSVSSWKPRHSGYSKFGAPSSSPSSSKWSSHKSSDNLDKKPTSVPFEYEKYLIKPSQATRSFSDFGKIASVPMPIDAKKDVLRTKESPKGESKDDHDYVNIDKLSKPQPDIMSTSLPSTAFDISKYLYKGNEEDFIDEKGCANEEEESTDAKTSLDKFRSARPKSYHHNNYKRFTASLNDTPSEQTSGQGNKSVVDTSFANRSQSKTSRHSSYTAEATFSNKNGSYNFYTPNPLGLGISESNNADTSEPKPDETNVDDLVVDEPSDMFEKQFEDSPKDKEMDTNSAKPAAISHVEFSKTDLPQRGMSQKAKSPTAEGIVGTSYHSTPARHTSPPKLSGFFATSHATTPIATTKTPPHEYQLVRATYRPPSFTSSISQESYNEPVHGSIYGTDNNVLRRKTQYDTDKRAPVHAAKRSSSEKHAPVYSGHQSQHRTAPMYGIARHDPNITDSSTIDCSTGNSSTHFSHRKQLFENRKELTENQINNTPLLRSLSNITHSKPRTDLFGNRNRNTQQRTSSHYNKYPERSLSSPVTETEESNIENGNSFSLSSHRNNENNSTFTANKNLILNLRSNNGNFHCDSHETESDTDRLRSVPSDTERTRILSSESEKSRILSSGSEAMNTSQDERDLKRSSSGSAIKFNIDFSATTV